MPSGTVIACRTRQTAAEKDVELNNAIRAMGERVLAGTTHVLEQHPRKLVAAIAALMLGAGGGAFAVASLEPAALPPLRQVVENVEPLALQAQAESLDAFRFNLFRTEQTRGSDTAETLLARLGINDPAAAAYLRNDAAFRARLLGRAGQTVTAEASDQQALVRLVARWAVDDVSFQRLVVERTAAGQFATRFETAPLVATQRVGSGTIQSSLFGAVDEAGIPDPVAIQMAEIFSGAIDFHRGLRKGDRFSVVYETLEGDGEPLRTGRVLSTEFSNGPRVLQAVWFQEPGKRGAYFDFNGRGLERAFLASPMEVTRVTSGFAMRFHPIFNQWRAHRGVDYGGPVGAPVRTVADGKVEFAGVQNGYGNVVIVDHGKGQTTLYAHLSRIDVKPGQMITRGQYVGALGATGWATGPHLHFEFRQNGEHKDPLEIARNAQGVELSAAARADFDRMARTMRTQLAAVAASPATLTAAR